MPKATIAAQIICYDKNVYKHNTASGDWLIHKWAYWTGWEGPEIMRAKKPRWKWVRIPCEDVPYEVKRLIK